MQTKTDLRRLLASGVAALLAGCAEPGLDDLRDARAFRLPETSPSAPTESGFIDDEAALELGRALFHDPRLNLDQRTSCAGCHVPWTAFAGPPARLTDGSRVDVPPLLGVETFALRHL